MNAASLSLPVSAIYLTSLNYILSRKIRYTPASLPIHNLYLVTVEYAGAILYPRSCSSDKGKHGLGRALGPIVASRSIKNRAKTQDRRLGRVFPGQGPGGAAGRPFPGHLSSLSLSSPPLSDGLCALRLPARSLSLSSPAKPISKARRRRRWREEGRDRQTREKRRKREREKGALGRYIFPPWSWSLCPKEIAQVAARVGYLRLHGANPNSAYQYFTRTHRLCTSRSPRSREKKLNR